MGSLGKDDGDPLSAIIVRYTTVTDMVGRVDLRYSAPYAHHRESRFLQRIARSCTC